MTNYGPPDAAVSYGGTVMTPEITTTLPSLDQQNQLDDATALGATIVRQIYTGLTDYGTIAIGGPYNPAAGGCDLVFGAAARNKTYGALVLTWGGTKTTTFSAVGVSSYKRAITKGNITGYDCDLFLGPGCTVTEA
jgi:hypothetical protein